MIVKKLVGGFRLRGPRFCGTLLSHCFPLVTPFRGTDHSTAPGSVTSVFCKTQLDHATDHGQRGVFDITQLDVGETAVAGGLANAFADRAPAVEAGEEKRVERVNVGNEWQRLLEVQVPKRAEYCRIIACELNRISSHLISVGTMAMDVGAVTPFPYALREREFINDLLEELCGARLTYNYLRIGGVAFDLPEGYSANVLTFVEHFEKILVEFDRLITYNEIFLQRLSGLAPIPREMAIDYCLVGPNLRASGVDWDLRRDIPYSIYPELNFDVPIGRGQQGATGDAWDRFWVRVAEMKQSCRILRQCLAQIPAGPVMAKLPRKLKPAEGLEAYSRIESARGDMQYYVVASGGENAHRVKIRTGSFNAMGIIDPLSRGLMIADLVALIASFDVVAPEIDR